MKIRMENDKISLKSGPHYIQEAEGLKIGDKLNVLSPRAIMCNTLTQARKQLRPGFVLIRARDLKIVGLK